MLKSNISKNILITGGNSGIGFHAVINLLKKRNNLYIPIKSIASKKKFFIDLRKYFDETFLNQYLNIIENVDFCNLENIKIIIEYIKKNNIFLDIVVLNAGIQYTGSFYPKVSKQGIELTFAINHLAHYYLTNALYPYILDSYESRIIITSSDVHDPKSSGGNIGMKAGLNNLFKLEEEVMSPFKNFNADKSYKNSKLCNILFAKELIKKLEIKNSKISVITWAPGLVIPNEGLGFFRYSSKFNQIGYFLFSSIAKNILGITESVQDAGNILHDIALDRNYDQIGYVHLSNRLISYRNHKLSVVSVSDEANNSLLASKLWSFSEKLCLSFGIALLDL